ncbi:hypothetical protein FHG87_019367 [Trinorchestia longiramus]|nr:hypothetical protein FHG87_019367 [Trinorchestia longiramus]
MGRQRSQRPNCMICNAKLSNSSLEPEKLREHFLELCGDGKYKNITLAKFKRQNRGHEQRHLGLSSCRSDFKPDKIQPSTRQDHRRFQSKPVCCIRALCERRCDKARFLFSKPLATTTTKAADVKKRVDNFFKENSFSWDMVSAVCSDGAPVMLERKFGFCALVKADAPHIIVTHRILHRHALKTKTLPPKLAEVLKIVEECVNYVRTSALRHRIFSELCKEIGSEFEVCLYHSNIRWLSRGQVLNRVFAVRVELALFLQNHQHCHADCFKNSEFIFILAYLADIFAALN